MYELKTVAEITRENFELLPYNDGEGAHSYPNYKLSSFQNLLRSRKIDTVIEIGAFLGKSSSAILSLIDSRAKIICIDSWLPHTVGKAKNKGVNDPYQQFLSNIVHQNYQDRVFAVKEDSRNALGYVKGMEADFIYVDGDHTTNGVFADISNYFNRLSENGLMGGDDWWLTVPNDHGVPKNSPYQEDVRIFNSDLQFPVRSAVKEFAQKNNLKLFIHENFWWYEK